MVDQNAETIFRHIYDETYQAILRFVIAKCGNVSDIEEVMQDTYFDLYSYLLNEEHKPIMNNEAFVITIAKKKLAKHYSMLERIKAVFQHGANEEQGIETLEDESDSVLIEDTVINKVLYDDIWYLLKSEPQDVQKIFHLYYLCDCSLKSIASELGIGLSDVKNKHYRTLKKLRKIYLGGDDDE